MAFVFTKVACNTVQVEGLIAREIEVAKELIAAKKRERALLALRRKQLREGQLEKIDAYLLNVEQVRCHLTLFHLTQCNTKVMESSHSLVAPPQVLANIEAAQRQNRLYDALKQGTVALQALQKVLERPKPSLVLPLGLAAVVWQVCRSTKRQSAKRILFKRAAT